jgi:UDP-glucose 4-epimerase
MRDFVHVSDLGSAHVKALDYLAGGGSSIALNLGTGKGTSIREILTMIRAFTGRTVPHEFVPSCLANPPVLYADSSLERNKLNWVPQFELE